MKRLAVPVIALLTALLFGSAHAQVAAPQAVNYQINSTHTGATTVPGLAPPLRQKWSVNFGQNISYPIVADGKVFVTVRNASAYGTQLYALNAATGAVVWSVPVSGTYYWSTLCYENGRVFVINADGLLRAFDGANGSLIWSRQMPGQYSFSAAPTVYQGVVYISGAGSGGTVYAVGADTGNVLWTASVMNGGMSSPAVTGDGVYVSYSCPNVYKLNPANGALIWRYSTGCSGGGGKIPALYNGRLYVRDFSDYIFDSQTGAQVGSFVAKNIPAFAGNMGFIMNGPKYFGSYATLEGRDLSSNTVTWTFAGDGKLQSAPLVVNDYVYIGSDTGKLFAVAAATGQQVWSTNVGVGIPYVDEQNGSQPLTGFAAGEGVLVIPTKTTLVAYESDHVAPTLTWGTQTPAANAAGWNNTPVDLQFTPADELSGVASAMPGSPLHFTTEGASQTQQVTVTDAAGNSAAFTSPAVNIDLTAPATSASLSGLGGSDDWYSGAVQVSLTSSDALSGLANTFYTTDGGAQQTYNAPFTITTSGNHNVNYWSVDVAGNAEAQQATTVKIDVSAPTTQAAVAGTNSNGWYQDPAQISLTASDAGSGVANSYYAVDGGATQTYAAPFNVSGGGSHTVSYWSVDAVGNTEQQSSLTVNVDTSAPSTQVATTGTTGNDGWYRSSVQVALTSADSAAGVASTYYRVDGGATQTYAGPFTVSGTARHNVNFWSVDKVGNTEAQRAVAVNIDSMGPTAQNVVTGPVGNSVYFNGPIQMSLTAADDLSGVANIYYRIGGGAQQTYTSPFTVSGDGTHPVNFWAVDVAGNNNYSYTIMIRIDASAPSTQAAAAGTAGTNGWYRSAVQVTLTAADNLSGLAGSYYTVDGGATQTYAGPFSIATAGAHTVVFWSRDQANNTESQRTLSFSIDANAPVITAAASPSSAAKRSTPIQVTISGRVTDTPSGVKPNSTTYSVLDEYGVTQPSGSVVLQSNGTYSFKLTLPATRNNKDTDGHKYTITIRSNDLAGNAGAASTVVTIL